MDEFLEKIQEAVEVGLLMSTRSSTATHSHSVAMTNLRTAELWAKADADEKAKRESVMREITE